MTQPSRPKRFRIGWPRSMAAQLMLLLAAALILANIVTMIVLGFERGRALQDVQRDAKLARVADLVATLQKVDRPQREAIVREGRNKGLRLRLAERPIWARRRVSEIDLPPRERALAERFASIAGVTLRDIRARPRGPRQFNLAIRLNDGQWLNVRLTRPPGAGTGVAVLAALILSLLAVLLAAFLFVRRIVRPLNALTTAMEGAGAGDREVRAPVAGTLETRTAATTFNAMQDSIAAFEAERARTAAAIGHDLRTPITSLRIRAEMLDDDALRDPMISTLDDMRVMADGLLGWGRSGGEREDSVDVDLTALVRDLATSNGNASAVSIQLDDITVRGRPVALRRAIGNLVDNALRHGGSAEVVVAQDNNRAVVSVSDNGPGLPDDMLEAVFEPFIRGDVARSPQEAGEDGGTGLGLSIARTIVRAHGGTLVLENRESGGLIARIELPL
ncbi:ATP-binding protein [Ahrensia sp. R2A130]|uniref:ATP-binding protein n=1 Tax=Ahrensia sp. R2A130 TaxID=744979 RepID=UPI0001E0ACCF|nr:ATP-binding protein [Ahrensia sp. R2A130]EFL88448.1 integral membrane sensor signal transduction histidine kinase [Ahrensia sp. R2A130]